MTTKTITWPALVQRMRRHARQDGHTFHVTRADGRAYNGDLGAFYETAGGFVQTRWRDLLALVEDARRLGVLQAYEVVTGVEESHA